MKSFAEWRKDETHIHHEKLGGVMGIYGDDIHDAIARIVYRLVPIVKESLDVRSAVETFDEMMEAVPVAFSIAVPELEPLPMMYGPGALKRMRETLIRMRKEDEQKGDKDKPSSGYDLKKLRTGRSAYDKPRDTDFSSYTALA